LVFLVDYQVLCRVLVIWKHPANKFAGYTMSKVRLRGLGRGMIVRAGGLCY